VSLDSQGQTVLKGLVKIIATITGNALTESVLAIVNIRENFVRN